MKNDDTTLIELSETELSTVEGGFAVDGIVLGATAVGVAAVALTGLGAEGIACIVGGGMISWSKGQMIKPFSES